MNEQNLKNRIKGTLIGCAYGDAMGMPTEMLTRANIGELFPEGIDKFYPTTKYDFIGRTMEAGEVTDDTINTILLCQMLIDNNGKIDAHLYINYLRQWIKDNPEKNEYVAGPSTKRSLAMIENGVPIEKTGTFGTTNGSAMKISPIGIMSDYHDMDQLVANVAEICMPTHNTSIAVAGACAVAACVSYGVRGGNDINELWNIAEEAIEKGINKGFDLPSVSLIKRVKSVRELVKNETEEEVIEQLKSFYGTGVETAETIPAVLAVVSIANMDPHKASCISATLGADTDTIGAIATAICGSMNPLFDKESVKLLESVNSIDFDYFSKNLAQQIVND